MKLPEFDIIHEGHVVRGMPVQAVAMEVKRDGVNQSVNGLHDLKYIMLSTHVFYKLKISQIYLLSVLLGRTVCDGERPRYEVILHVNNDYGRSRPYNLNISISVFSFSKKKCIKITFFIQPFQQKTNSCLLMLPSPDTLKIINRSLMS